MNEQQIWKHLKRKYQDGEKQATVLMDVYNLQSKLLTLETRDSMRNVLRTPICTGVVFGQLARDYRERNGSSIKPKDTQETTDTYLQRDIECVKQALSDLKNHWSQGRIEGELFCVTYVEDTFLLASIKNDGHLLERLVAACSRIIQYEPFCKYTDLGGMKTYEWDKNNSNERYKELNQEGKNDLVRLDKPIR